MLNDGIIEINNLNKEFYAKHNESFDKSRFMEWEGFNNVLKYITKDTKILDLGCGNGRFLEFLNNKNTQFDSYLGIDNSADFINKNKLKFSNAKFEERDILNQIDEITNKYDLVVIFGVSHHIPYEEYRKEWFQKIKNLISKNGTLVISFWEFDIKKADQKFSPKIYKPQKGDYFLGWKDDFSQHRFCHYYDEKELQNIISIFQGFEVSEIFSKDKNKYLILKNNS